MIIIRTIPNTKKNKGIYTVNKINGKEIHATILKIVFGNKGNKNIKESIAFDPESYTQIKEVQPTWFSVYPEFFNTTETDIKRKDYTKTLMHNILNSNTIDEFLSVYKEFLVKNTDFLTNKKNYYKRVYIPKQKPGEYRSIDIPCDELKELQTRAYNVLKKEIRIRTHDAAFGYVENRDNVKNAERHKYSNYITTIDYKNCFPSVTKDFISRQLLKLSEFATINVEKERKEDNIFKMMLSKEDNKLIMDYRILAEKIYNAIIELAELENTLPQGSPLSPHLLNLILVEVDERLYQNICKNKKIAKSTIMYTRYSDDMVFSSSKHMNTTELLKEVRNQLENCEAPLKINPNKIKELKPKNKCYITGVKINNENKTSYGHERKEILKKDLFSILMSYTEGTLKKEDAAQVLGQISYMHKIEPEYTKAMIRKYALKFKIDPKNIYKELLN